MKKMIVGFVITAVAVSAASTTVFAGTVEQEVLSDRPIYMCGVEGSKISAKLCQEVLSKNLALNISEINTEQDIPAESLTQENLITYTSNYVDADGNGICDNLGTAGANYGSGRGQDANYVDADNDGICDNLGTAGANYGSGRGQGANYVDADNDGICDNYSYHNSGNKTFRNRGFNKTN